MSEEAIVRIVDDDPSFLRAAARRLEAAGFQVRTFGSAADFLSADAGTPGCVVVDLRMPGAGGLELQEAIERCENPLPVLFLSGHGDVPSSVRAMKRGAVDFLVKPVAGDELVDAVCRALVLDASTRTDRRHVRELRSRYERLTVREREVMSLVVRGLLNKQIAGTIGTSERTVKAHRARVMQKMLANSVADLTRAAERLRVGL